MEFPRRPAGDELLGSGELTGLLGRLRGISASHDLATVIACAFDYRTRMLPYIYADRRLAPAGVRAVGSALVAAGFTKTRIVQQQWNRNFRPSLMKLDGRVPDLFLVSSMQIHAAECRKLIRDACRIDPSCRPLIIAGGPKAIYEPWGLFSADGEDPAGPDVVVTGEEFVLLSLLEAVLSVRAGGQSLRAAFFRARDGGALDAIPGLVYPRTDSRGAVEELVNTGVQRLLGDLDELPHPVLGYALLEPPSRRATLSARALEPSRVGRYSPIGALVMTSGCEFACTYCPIPSYNQRQLRSKSGPRVADEMSRLYRQYGIRFYLGADDNFFADRKRAAEIAETLAAATMDGRPLRDCLRWGTEATVHDTLKCADLLPLVRKAGLRALWVGVEDMTATLVRKGQSVAGTLEAFALLRRAGILPNPMLMHHDGQPLLSFRGQYGLLNQVATLRKAGAMTMQILMLSPSPGSRCYDQTYTDGLVVRSVGGQRVQEHMFDGNYVVASAKPRPWRLQLNMLIAYLYFYNPLRFLVALVRPRHRMYLANSACQLIGMWGVANMLRRTLGWALRLMLRKIVRCTSPPAAPVPIRSVNASAVPAACSALPASTGPTSLARSKPLS
jgi:radical SAM superfamily enzyme YgiQ (UPF0313 family)